MSLAEIKIEFHGPIAEHNFPCPVCQGSPAVYNFKGVFGPCWACRVDGFRLVKFKGKRGKFLRWLLGVE